MNAEEFNFIVESQINLSLDVLVKKAGEYADDTDRLHNFKVAAVTSGAESPMKACAGMMAKHTVSVYDMIRSGEDYPISLWEEKITDHINYLLLLKALVVEAKQ